MKVKKYLKDVVIGIATVTLLWSQIAWAMPCVNPKSDIGLEDKLAAMSGAYGAGIQAAARQEVAGLFSKSAILKEMGITNLTDIVRNMDELARKGIICFSRPDIKDSSRNAIYIFEDDAFIKVTKPGEPVITDFDELLEISGKEDTVGDTQYEWYKVPKDETKLGLINSFLGNISDGRWQIDAEKVKRSRHLAKEGEIKEFITGVVVGYDELEGRFVDSYEVKLDLSKGKGKRFEKIEESAESISRLLDESLDLLEQIVSEDVELNKYLQGILNSPDNMVPPVVIMVNSVLPVNAVRYFNETQNRVEVIFSETFIQELISAYNAHPEAVKIILAERLFHELGHNNRIGTKEEEREEEKQLIKRDLRLHQLVINSVRRKLVEAYLSEVNPTFKSGYYFKVFIQEQLIPVADNVEELNKRIDTYLDRNYRFIGKIGVKAMAAETGRSTKDRYLAKVNGLKDGGELSPINLSEVNLQMTAQQQEEYLKVIEEVLNQNHADVITPEILFKAANRATENYKSKVSARIGLQPGTFNPLHYGHITASLACILDEKLGLVMLANGGTVPDRPYAVNPEIRNEMARIACSETGLNEWLTVTPIRGQVVDMFMSKPGLLQKAGKDENIRRFNMDMAAFIWLFMANPKVEWYYLVGADKVSEYGMKGEKELLIETLDKSGVKVIYFARTGEDIRVDENIRPYPWLKSLWDKGFFRKSASPRIGEIKSEKAKTAIVHRSDLVDGLPITESISQTVLDYINQNEILKFLYKLEVTEKEGDELVGKDEKSKGKSKYIECLRMIEEEIDKPETQRMVDITMLEKLFDLILRKCFDKKIVKKISIRDLRQWQLRYKEETDLIISLTDLVSEEYYEIVDKEGKPVKKIKPKRLINIDGDLHRDVRILVFNSKGELLVRRRGVERDREPWAFTESVSGRLQLGENWLGGVLRRMKKELGIETLNRERLFELGTYSDEERGLDTLNRSIYKRYVYVLTEKQESIVKIENGVEIVGFEELESLRKKAIADITEGEVERLFTNSLREALAVWEDYNKITDVFKKIEENDRKLQGLIRGELTDEEIEAMSVRELADILRVFNLKEYNGEEKFLLYSAAPATGKGTIMDLSFENPSSPYSDLVQRLVLYHTRRPRVSKGEVDGKEYHFGRYYVGDKSKNRLWVLYEQRDEEGKRRIYLAYVNKQLQGLARKDFVEEVRVHITDPAERMQKGDSRIGDGNDVFGDYILVNRPIKGLGEVFGAGEITILEGGYGWYESIKKGEEDPKERIFTIFISPFTDDQINLRTSNKMIIDSMFSFPEDRFKAYRALNKMRKDYEMEEINLEKNEDLRKEIQRRVAYPLEDFELTEGADLGRFNAGIIESEQFIEDLNWLLQEYFKSDFRINTSEEKALARELAYEVHRRLIEDRGRGSYLLLRPDRSKEGTGDFSDPEDAYNRVLEGIIQIMLRNEYKENATGEVVVNEFVWSGDINDIERRIEQVTEDFCKAYFKYLLRDINKKAIKDEAIISDMLEKHNEANKLLYMYLLAYVEGDMQRMASYKGLFDKYIKDGSLRNRQLAAQWLNRIINWIENEVRRIRDISDLDTRKKEFWKFYDITNFGGAKGAPWGKTLLLRLYLPSVLHDANQNIKDLVLAIIDGIDHGKKIEDFPSICCQCGIGKDSEDWNTAVQEIYPLVKDFVKENSIVASSLSLHPDKLNKKEIIYSTVKIDSLGNIVSMDVKDEARGDTRFNEELVKEKLKELVAYLKARHGEGVLGPVEEIVIVDNMGGIDSDIPPEQRGSVAYFRGKQMLIDIDVFKNDIAIKDVGGHESFEAILKIVEQNPAIREVTATYGALKALLELNPEDLDSYIAFLSQPDNGLDSEEYAKLLKYIQENRKTIDDDSLISLSIGYVLNTPRYKHLEESLKGVLASDAKGAGKKMELARNIYRDIVIAKTNAMDRLRAELKPVIDKTKLAQVKMKIRMLTSVWNVDLSFINTLLQTGKFVRLDIDELSKERNKHILDWLKRLTPQQQGAFVFFSSSNRDIRGFLNENNLAGKVDSEVKPENVITLLELEGLNPDPGVPLGDEKGLCLPYIYSITGIYLAAQVVIASGDINGIRDNLVRTTLEKTYETLFGEKLSDNELNQLFHGKWPKAYRITETINVLRNAIAQIEIAA